MIAAVLPASSRWLGRRRTSGGRWWGMILRSSCNGGPGHHKTKNKTKRAERDTKGSEFDYIHTFSLWREPKRIPEWYGTIPRINSPTGVIHANTIIGIGKSGSGVLWDIVSIWCFSARLLAGKREATVSYYWGTCSTICRDPTICTTSAISIGSPKKHHGPGS